VKECSKTTPRAGRQQAHSRHEVRLHDSLGISLPGIRAVRCEVEDPIWSRTLDAGLDGISVEEVDERYVDVTGQPVETPLNAAGTQPRGYVMAGLE